LLYDIDRKGANDMVVSEPQTLSYWSGMADVLKREFEEADKSKTLHPITLTAIRDAIRFFETALRVAKSESNFSEDIQKYKWIISIYRDICSDDRVNRSHMITILQLYLTILKKLQGKEDLTPAEFETLGDMAEFFGNITLRSN